MRLCAQTKNGKAPNKQKNPLHLGSVKNTLTKLTTTELVAWVSKPLEKDPDLNPTGRRKDADILRE